MKFHKSLSEKWSKKIKSILYYAVLALVFLYAFSIPTFSGQKSSIHYITYVFMGLITVCVALYWYFFGLKVNFKRWQYLVIPMFFIFALIGTIAFSHQFKAWFSLVLLAFSFFVFVPAFSIIADKNIALVLISVALFCFSVYFIYYYRDEIIHFRELQKKGIDRIGWDFNNPNDISAMCAVGISSTLYLILFWKKKIKYVLLIALAAIGIVGFSTGSRTFIVAIIVIALTLLFFRFGKHKLLFLILVAGTVVLLLVIINLPFAYTLKYRFQSFFNTLFTDSAKVDTSTLERMLWFDYGFAIGFKNIVIGYGVDGFAVYSGVGTYAHSNLAECICDFGIIGTFIFYAPLFILAHNTLVYKNKSSRYVIPIFIYYLVVSFSNVFYYNKFYYLILAFMFYATYEHQEKVVKIKDLKTCVKNIVFTCDGMESGGAEKVIATLANSLQSTGYNVSIVGVSSANSKSFYELNNGVKYITLRKEGHNRIGVFKRIFVLNKTLRSLKPDIVIAFLPHVIVYTNFAMFNINKPLIVSERNDPYSDPKGFVLRLLKKYSFAQANGCVFQTKDAQGFFSRAIQNESVIIDNPVQIKYPGEISNKADKRVISVGRLNKQKNFKLLIDSFGLFHEKHPDYVLNIYGSGELKNELQNSINQKHLERAIFLRGNSDSWHTDEHNSSLFVSSSNYEGMPNALAEAIALGIPVVSTDCPIGGPKSLVVNGVNGYLCNVNDQKDLLNKMEEALSLKIHKSDVETFKSKHSPEYICECWTNYIKTVLERRMTE